ncbi:MAG: 50S ribosomal protein L16 [Candidatus Aenigmatarchaeota archaeon]
MAIRPGRCYHHQTNKPYTRVSRRSPRKSYVKGVPVGKIHHFETGNVKGAASFPLTFHIVCTQNRQMRSNCLEAARVSATKYLTAKVGETNFFLKIRPYPHHVLREKPLATGAGADRFSEGMRRSFGKPHGVSARIKAGQKVVTVKAIAGKEKEVKEALRRASMKLPGKCRIVLE